jgi:ABC-2 type transport system ATP-binding protein
MRQVTRAERHGEEGDKQMQGLRFEEVRFAYAASGLRRRATVPVFEDLTWVAPPGRTVLLGPNGAGKSTLLSLAATALRPADGSIHFGELDAGVRSDRRQLRRLIGWMPQQARAVPGLTVREQVAYAGWLKGLSRGDAWARAAGAVARVGLNDEASRDSAHLSGGQLRRVALAQLFVHDAVLLLLDEPTAGLDPGQRARFRDLVGNLGIDTPIILSTHQVDDLDGLYETVVILDHGVIRFEGSPASFLALAPPEAARPAEAAYASLVQSE